MISWPNCNFSCKTFLFQAMKLSACFVQILFVKFSKEEERLNKIIAAYELNYRKSDLSALAFSLVTSK